MSDHYQSRHVILCVEVSRGNYLFVLELIVKWVWKLMFCNNCQPGRTLADPGLNIRGATSLLFPLSPPLPFPSLPFSCPLLPFTSLPFPSLSLPSLPLEVGPLWLRLAGLGSPKGTRRSPAAKRILVHFRHKFAPFWVLWARRIFCVFSPLKECGNYWELCVPVGPCISVSLCRPKKPKIP